jgi:hypothetical protein
MPAIWSALASFCNAKLQILHGWLSNLNQKTGNIAELCQMRILQSRNNAFALAKNAALRHITIAF